MTLVGEDFSDNTKLNELLADRKYQHVILYPSAASVCVGSALSSDKKLRVILLDGTWKKAFKMWQISSNLHGLKTIHLPKDLKGNYRIRKAPSENSLSTVEAGYHLLRLLENDGDFSPLLTAFDQMIQFQINQMPPGVFEKNYLLP